MEKTETTKYTIEKRITERDCSHEKCESMHRRFIISGNNGVHMVEEIVWTIVDENGWDVETYETKKDAASYINYMMEG